MTKNEAYCCWDARLVASGLDFELDDFLASQSDQAMESWRTGDRIGKSILTARENTCSVILVKASAAWDVYEEIGQRVRKLGTWMSAATDRKGSVQLCLTIFSGSGSFPAICMPSEFVQFLGQYSVSIDIDII